MAAGAGVCSRTGTGGQMSLRTILLFAASPSSICPIRGPGQATRPRSASSDSDGGRRCVPAYRDAAIPRVPRKNDPRDPWLASDNYEVDYQAFTSDEEDTDALGAPVPRRMRREPVDASQGNPPRVQIMIRNVYEMSQLLELGGSESGDARRDETGAGHGRAGCGNSQGRNDLGASSGV